MNLYEVTKRIIDVVGAIGGVILFFPLLIGGAIWVKLVSPNGPVFADIPDRVGKNKKPFRMLKFRSMVPNGYEYLKNNYPELHKKYMENNYKLSAEEDPRLLKGAKIIRKLSIDEMPQFFNVLAGDMSIVGPRAYYFFEIDEQLVKYPEAAQYLDEALRVKPGITGLWQVSGRSEVGFVDRVKLDAIYAGKKSILFDLLIILKTPFVVISGKGAF
jgi:lipopolysaccharide/colanic/teichoic acid biosynthesis glycosyltransferase